MSQIASRNAEMPSATPSPRMAGSREATRPTPIVDVDDVEVLPAGTTGPLDRCRISAVVRLGDLTPADVLVRLMPLADSERQASSDAHDRLWSVARYDHGA